jgi:PKD repeat protein
VGAVTLSGTARASEQLSFSAAFKDIDVTDSHKASWSWGDGSKDVGTISEKDGGGNSSAQHAFAAPGIYTVRLTVTDSSGMSTTVQKKITVVGSGAYVAGEGWFMSPRGASRMAQKQGGIATFAVLSNAVNAPGATQANVEFTAAGINFHSQQIDTQSMQGDSVQVRGRGKVNGTDGYYFMLNSARDTTSGSGHDWVRVRIWHYAPDSKTEVVDYDNQADGRASNTDRQGTVVGEGAITIQSN